MAGRFCGHSNPDLSVAGEAQLAAMVDRVCTRQITRLLSSDLVRASRAAEAIGSKTGVRIELRPGLREIGFGRWEGLKWDEIETQFPREAALWMQIAPQQAAPGGEPYEIFTARVHREFESLLEKAIDSVTAVVTHRGVIEFALTTIFKIPKDEAWKRTGQYCVVLSLTSVSHRAGQNRADHLPGAYTMEVL
jgi:broad specificity phosphatase PhoE